MYTHVVRESPCPKASLIRWDKKWEGKQKPKVTQQNSGRTWNRSQSLKPKPYSLGLAISLYISKHTAESSILSLNVYIPCMIIEECPVDYNFQIKAEYDWFCLLHMISNFLLYSGNLWLKALNTWHLPLWSSWSLSEMAVLPLIVSLTLGMTFSFCFLDLGKNFTEAFCVASF